MIKLYNTLHGKSEVFRPKNPDRITIYTCGPTVYSEPHIGNWVAFIRWDILVRLLLSEGLSVERVMNITDVGHLVSDADEGEDKMSKGARKEGVSEWDIAERYTNRFLEGMTSLNILPPEHLTKATEHIDIQIDLIRQLEDRGYTYVLDDGVYYDTSRFPKYADFAHLDLDAQKAGARVEFNKRKRNISDFVLWRLTPAGESRTMEWESPWGKGQPGWHIECSAMAMQYLGETLDIHTGGIDHIPVHHTNEIAQSEAATGKPFANYWLHCAHLLSDGTKLSKSLNNSYTLSDITKKGFSTMDFRLFILQSHYRTETNFSFENLVSARNRYHRWLMLSCLRHQLESDSSEAKEFSREDDDTNRVLLSAPNVIREALHDDLNTPEALKAIDKAFDAIEKSDPRSIERTAFDAFLKAIEDLLGILLLAKTPDISDDDIRLIQERLTARSEKNWQRSDEIRNDLLARGIALNDTQYGSYWYHLID